MAAFVAVVRHARTPGARLTHGRGFESRRGRRVAPLRTAVQESVQSTAMSNDVNEPELRARLTGACPVAPKPLPGHPSERSDGKISLVWVAWRAVLSWTRPFRAATPCMPRHHPVEGGPSVRRPLTP